MRRIMIVVWFFNIPANLAEQWMTISKSLTEMQYELLFVGDQFPNKLIEMAEKNKLIRLTGDAFQIDPWLCFDSHTHNALDEYVYIIPGGYPELIYFSQLRKELIRYSKPIFFTTSPSYSIRNKRSILKKNGAWENFSYHAINCFTKKSFNMISFPTQLWKYACTYMYESGNASLSYVRLLFLLTYKCPEHKTISKCTVHNEENLPIFLNIRCIVDDLLYIRQFLALHTDDANAINAADTLEHWVIDECIKQCIAYIPSNTVLSTLNLLVETWGAERVLSVSSHYPFYGTRFVQLFRNMNSFKARRGAIHTLGMYYTRLYNGGIERVICKLTPIFLRMGFEVILFTDEPSSPNDYQLPPNVRRVLVSGVSPWDRVQAWMNLLRENPVDIMISHAWVSRNLAWDSLAIKSSGAFYIQHTHGIFTSLLKESDSQLHSYFYVLPDIYQLFDGVVSLSQVDVAFWNNFVPRSYFTVNPVVLPVEQYTISPVDGFRVLWLARLAFQKQPEEALEIFSLVVKKEPRAQLDIVGAADPGSPYLELIEKKIIELNLGSNVTMHGYQTDVEYFYIRSAVYLSTSCYEGSPMTIMESKAYGLPCVAYAMPYLEMMREPKGMIIVPQKDRQAAADALTSLLKNKEYRSKLGSDARLDAMKYASYDISGHWRDIFNDLQTGSIPPKNETSRIMIETILYDCKKSFDQQSADNKQLPAPYRKARTIKKYIYKYGLFHGVSALVQEKKRQLTEKK